MVEPDDSLDNVAAPVAVGPLPPPTLDALDAPSLALDEFKTVGVRTDGTTVIEKGACIGTRRDMTSCDRPAFSRDLCQACYRRARRSGEIGRITLTWDHVHTKFLEIGSKSPPSLASFSKTIGVDRGATRRWLVELERREIAVMQYDINDKLPRWHLSDKVVLPPPPVPRPPRQLPLPPGKTGRPRRRSEHEMRDALRPMARGWPRGW